MVNARVAEVEPADGDGSLVDVVVSVGAETDFEVFRLVVEAEPREPWYSGQHLLPRELEAALVKQLEDWYRSHPAPNAMAAESSEAELGAWAHNHPPALQFTDDDESSLYDVALSFAGEDRLYVDEVARHLEAVGVRVFYDQFETVSLWGRDLYQLLAEIYSRRARFTVVFVSHHYAEKRWTSHELRAAQEKAFRESADSILPARFDDTELPGVFETTGFIDLRELEPHAFGRIVHQRVRPRRRPVSDLRARRMQRLAEYAYSSATSAQPDRAVEWHRSLTDLIRAVVADEADVLLRDLRLVATELVEEIVLAYGFQRDGRESDCLWSAATSAVRRARSRCTPSARNALGC